MLAYSLDPALSHTQHYTFSGLTLCWQSGEKECEGVAEMREDAEEIAVRGGSAVGVRSA
jgi:hypothetical protein